MYNIDKLILSSNIPFLVFRLTLISLLLRFYNVNQWILEMSMHCAAVLLCMRKTYELRMKTHALTFIRSKCP